MADHGKADESGSNTHGPRQSGQGVRPGFMSSASHARTPVPARNIACGGGLVSRLRTDALELGHSQGHQEHSRLSGTIGLTACMMCRINIGRLRSWFSPNKDSDRETHGSFACSGVLERLGVGRYCVAGNKRALACQWYGGSFGGRGCSGQFVRRIDGRGAVRRSHHFDQCSSLPWPERGSCR